MSDSLPNDKAELLAEVESIWTAMNAALDELTLGQYTSPTDPLGWNVRDHVCHMAAWDNWAVSIMNGRPGWEGMGISEEAYRADGTDGANAAIRERHMSKSPSEARSFLQASHNRLMGMVAALSDEELARPFRPLRADEPPDRVIPPTRHVVYETTADHYEEHLEWFLALAATAESPRAL